jgi:hypothetical protein
MRSRANSSLLHRERRRKPTGIRIKMPKARARARARIITSILPQDLAMRDWN